MKFFMKMIPPSVTHQEKQVTVRNGKPVFYEPARLKDARGKLTAHLYPNRPIEPLEGPLSLKVMWLFPKGNHKEGSFKVTRPDTDNLQKLLKDCMTTTGFWYDDAQVCSEYVEKRWSKHTGIYIDVEQAKEE